MLKDMQRGLLVSPRQEQYLKRTQGNVTLSPKALAFVQHELTAGDRDRRFTFSASGRGGCLRQQVFSYLNVPGEKTWTSDQSSTFIHGSWTHLKWQAMGLDAGWLAKVEVPCRIDAYSVTGTIDGILDTGEGWELKSINSRGFRNVTEYGPQQKHLLQVHSYMLATGIKVWSLIYECKDDQEWREWVIHWDDDLGAELINELDRLNEIRAKRELPKVRDDCADREGTHYRNCPFRGMCLETHEWPTRAGIRIVR